MSLPRLAKGGVLTEATTVIAGEYSGAKTNPEIVTPQNIMRDTFEDVLSNYSGNNNDRPIYLTVNVGDKKLGQILLDDLRENVPGFVAPQMYIYLDGTELLEYIESNLKMIDLQVEHSFERIEACQVCVH